MGNYSFEKIVNHVKVSGFDNSKVGTNKITIEYEGKTTSFEVEIISKQITRIEVNSCPIKTNYIQNSENLDLTGGNIKVIYSDNSIDIISMTNENVKVTGFDNITSYLYGDEMARIQHFPEVGLPYCAGYAIGYYLIKYYLEKTGVPIEKATILPAAEILNEVKEFWK